MPASASKSGSQTSLSPDKSAKSQKRLSFKEKQELASLPARIEKLEADLEAMHASMADPEFFKQEGEAIATEQARLKQLESELAAAYERWEELE